MARAYIILLLISWLAVLINDVGGAPVALKESSDAHRIEQRSPGPCNVGTCAQSRLGDILNQYNQHNAKPQSGGTGSNSFGRRRRSVPDRKQLLPHLSSSARHQ
uniref:Putative conserved secreted protein n=1 Tax=Ornithodoros turicata TaxID=34597 RepID=A0A2R5L5B7_9ACAR